MSTVVNAERRRLHERRFYVGAGIVMLASVFLGFGRTYFLRPWFPEAAALAPTESFFFNIHGVCFTAWMVLLVAQTLLIASRRVAFHRTLGWFGAGLAVAVVVVGVLGALIAARRPGGFIGVRR